MTRRLLVLLALAASLGLAACGNAEQEREVYQSENAQVAETEGIYLDVDGLKYQVQLSKQLNTALPDDGPYLDRVLPAYNTLAEDEVWFAVFMRAENDGDKPAEMASDFVIKDTQDNTYRPVQIGKQSPWSYQPTTVAPDQRYPGPNTPAGERTPNGSLLLFKVKRTSLDNRPLELEITGRDGQKGVVDLDV